MSIKQEFEYSLYFHFALISCLSVILSNCVKFNLIILGLFIIFIAFLVVLKLRSKNKWLKYLICFFIFFNLHQYYLYKKEIPDKLAQSLPEAVYAIGYMDVKFKNGYYQAIIHNPSISGKNRNYKLWSDIKLSFSKDYIPQNSGRVKLLGSLDNFSKRLKIGRAHV